MKWFPENLVYLTIHGSKAYGLSNELSDLDIKGICIPPRSVEYDLFHKFEQSDNHPFVEAVAGHLKNPKNPKLESTVFSLRKLFVLASNINPNIIEVLWTDPSDHIMTTELSDTLMENRNLFLSSKAKFTFSGYAFSQAAKIERHRKWIVLGELKEPTRAEFGLPDIRARQLDEVFGFIKSEVERWNLSKFPMEEQDRAELKETIWELVDNVSQLKVGWDNWPQVYEASVVDRIAKEYDLKDEVVDLLNRERNFKRAKEQYSSWLNWKKNRNVDRHKLEVKSGYDTKHASHLVRLMRMGQEILVEGKVIVKRPDAEEILHIKNGGWSYDRVMEHAKDIQSKMDEAYKSTILPRSVDFEKLNSLYHSLYEKYARL